MVMSLDSLDLYRAYCTIRDDRKLEQAGHRTASQRLFSSRNNWQLLLRKVGATGFEATSR